MNHHTNRRAFLQSTAASSLALGATAAWGAPATAPPRDTLRIALIGAGERGRGFIGKVAQLQQELVAVCDVDQWRIDHAPNLPTGVRSFHDYRQLLAEMGDEIDAVIIAAPHHAQAAISIAAMRAGKHVYCEKPIAHDVGEARAVRETVNQTRVVTQMGNQGVATDSFRRILEQVQDGAIGEIREAHQWYVTDVNKPPSNPRGFDLEATDVPEGLDWNLFLGPAKNRPYHGKYMKWANWRDFGTGMLGMGGSHSCHMTFNALRLRELWDGKAGPPATIRVEAECSEVAGEQFPQWEIVRFDVPARGELPPARIHWSKGLPEDLARLGVTANLEKIAGRSLDWGAGWAPTSGSLVVGAAGVVHTNMHNSECALLPLDKFPDQGGRPRRLPHSGSQEREWANACLGRGPAPFSNFDYAGPVIELLLLGNICTLLGRAIEYDPVAGRIVNDYEANQALRPARREGWPLIP
jgi:hypothetical protein